MAIFPCDRGPHHNPARNSLFYVSIGAGNDFDRWKLRLCAEHTALVQDNLAKYEVSLIQATPDVSGYLADCFTCGDPLVEAGQQLFVTGYPTKDEREDYWARVHETCVLPDYLSPPDDMFGSTVAADAPAARVPARVVPTPQIAPKQRKN